MLEPYTAFWDIWIDTPACFLSVREIVLIRIYLKTGCYAACAEILKSNIIVVANDLINIVTRLKLLESEYMEWESSYKINQNTLLHFDSQFMLHAPVFLLPVSRALKIRFKLIGERSLSSVLERYSASELIESWGMKAAELEELERLLKRYVSNNLYAQYFSSMSLVNSRSP